MAIVLLAGLLCLDPSDLLVKIPQEDWRGQVMKAPGVAGVAHRDMVGGIQLKWEKNETFIQNIWSW